MMRQLSFVCTLLFSISSACLASPREWTNQEGQKISASFLRVDGTNAILERDGSEISYPIAKLSAPDQEWIKETVEAQLLEKAKKVEGLIGVRRDVPITARLFEEPKEYFNEGTRRKSLKAYEGGAYDNKGNLEDWLSRDPGADRMTVYCPESYNGSEAYGLYLHISPGAKGAIDKRWLPILDEYKLIAVSANGVGNKSADAPVNPALRRVSLSLDAMATVMEDYEIDPERRVVGGLSGGGHMAFLTQALYPEMFQGAISSAAQSYLPGHFPGFSISDFTRGIRHERKWVIISGDKDYNYPIIQKESIPWQENNMLYQFIDVPGMGHTNFDGESFKKALEFIGLPTGE